MNISSNKADPNWLPWQHYSEAQLPGATRQWLLDEGSLTDHLVRASDGHFRVERLSQDWQLARASECGLLGLAPDEQVLVREVALLCHEQPVVFARSILPRDLLDSEHGHLGQLEGESLGRLLFQNADLGRDPFELALLSADSAYVPSALRGQSDMWARRSRFSLDNHQLMVSEVFLAGFQPWPQASASV